MFEGLKERFGLQNLESNKAEKQNAVGEFNKEIDALFGEIARIKKDMEKIEKQMKKKNYSTENSPSGLKERKKELREKERAVWKVCARFLPALRNERQAAAMFSQGKEMRMAEESASLAEKSLSAGISKLDKAIADLDLRINDIKYGATIGGATLDDSRLITKYEMERDALQEERDGYAAALKEGLKDTDGNIQQQTVEEEKEGEVAV